MPLTHASSQQRTTRSNSNPATNITLMDIKTLIEKSNQQILETLKSEIDKQASMIASLVSRVDALTNTNIQLEKKYQLLEENNRDMIRSFYREFEDRDRRKMNLIFSGIPERQNGTLEERNNSDFEHVKRVLADLSLPSDHVTAHTYRIGKPGKGGQQLLKVKCLDEEFKRNVLRKAKQLRNISPYERIFINADLTFVQRQERRLLADELRRRRGLGEDVMIRNGTFVPKQNSKKI